MIDPLVPVLRRPGGNSALDAARAARPWHWILFSLLAVALGVRLALRLPPSPLLDLPLLWTGHRLWTPLHLPDRYPAGRSGREAEGRIELTARSPRFPFLGVLVPYLALFGFQWASAVALGRVYLVLGALLLTALLASLDTRRRLSFDAERGTVSATFEDILGKGDTEWQVPLSQVRAVQLLTSPRVGRRRRVLVVQLTDETLYGVLLSSTDEQEGLAEELNLLVARGRLSARPRDSALAA